MSTIFDFFVSLLYKQLIDPKSKYYLPKQIQANGFDPFRASSFPNPPPPVLEDGANLICAIAGASQDPPTNGKPSHNPSLKLSNVVVSGLSNAQLDVPKVTDHPDSADVTDTVTFSMLSGMQANVIIAGNFTMAQTCCGKDDAHREDPCEPGDPRFDTVASGIFEAAIVASSGSGSGKVTAISDAAVITIDSLNFSAAATADNIVVTIDITSVTDPDFRKDWNDYAGESFKQDSTLQSMVDSVNSMLDAPDIRALVGRKLTEELNSIIGDVPEARRKLAGLRAT